MTQSPNGRVWAAYVNRPSFTASSDFAEFIRVEDQHGHYGFFTGSNGRQYAVRPLNPQVGCPEKPYWQTFHALYDAETGQRVLNHWDCDIEGQHAWNHFTRSIGAADVFGFSSERYTFAPSAKFYPTDEAIVRAEVKFEGGQPRKVVVEPVTYHRTAAGERSKLVGRDCGYWASSRPVIDYTGRRFLFDSTMSHPEWPAAEVDGVIKTSCQTDVYVAEKNSLAEKVAKP